MKTNKLTSVLLSVLIAFGLWFYVVTNVSQNDEATFYNIPVVIKGESQLASQNLMVTRIYSDTVSLRLSGARSDLNKVNSGNITVEANLSGISEPGERIAVRYSISYPGNVASDALNVEERKPSNIYVDVDYRQTKEVPVHVEYTGTRMEGYIYDTDNAALDSTVVTISGPASVIDQIAMAKVDVDLTDRLEPISEGFRYTLCDGEKNPIDAEAVTTNVESVWLDLQIQRIKELALRADILYGGGANEASTTVTISPLSIQVTGSDAVLSELGDSLSLGTINLAELDKMVNEQRFPIVLPEGVTNRTGVGEAVVTVEFAGLKTREFTVENITSVNIPEGLTAELISASLTVKVRGPLAEVDQLTAEDITATVDFSSAEAGTATYRASITFPQEFPNVGVLRSVSVSATVQPVGG